MSLFSKVSGNKPNRNVFDLGHERKFSMNMGELVPILCEEVLPGDTFQMKSEVMMRLAPMVAPVMHRVNVYTHFFFVPNRLIWDEWKDFITGGVTGDEVPVRPYISFSSALSIGNGSLMDYLGMAPPEGAITVHKVSSLPMRAYQLIYNEYYLDQNLQTPVDVPKTSGSDAANWSTLVTLRKRCWEKDYFTSALPWTQRGGDVTLPLGNNAPVVLRDNLSSGVNDYQNVVDSSGNLATVSDGLQNLTSGKLANDGSSLRLIDPNGTMEADLSQVSGATIEELRRATKLQRWLERNARTGSRYIEQIMAHFGVKSSDARLQRPEFLGGGKTPVVISEVLQTSSTDAETPQGNMSGHGVAVGRTHGFKKFFEEHGYVIGIMSVLPKTAYMQGTRRHFYKTDKFDYFWPEFAQLGEQPVLKGELFTEYDGTDSEEVFGYQSRYSEYKYIPSTVHGDFRGDLNHWHMSRQFGSKPTLNSGFVESDPTHRVFAVTDESQAKLYVQVYNDLKAIRPIPYFNNPSL